MSVSSRNARLLLSATLGVLVPVSAHAAELTLVNGWKGNVNNLPSDVTMSIYVPDKLATNPPVVTIIHYCGGTAQTVYGQAKDIVTASHDYGFILIFPANTHSGGCWDVSSKKTQTHDGGGDSHAIAQMVRYTIDKYKANANRVYSTGDSSGGMMTQLLMAVYPDIFKAGSAFAGVPAGCSNIFDGNGLCGLPAQTAQQWGDRVRDMYPPNPPGYTGHRPRVQMFHGDKDTTIVYGNYGESIKEWTNVLGLSTKPTTTIDTGITLGDHQGKREQWKNACGYVVLDGFTSLGGEHGPPDCLFIGKYVLPFLGLDSQAAVDAPVDPEIAQCGGGSDGGVTTPDAGKADGAMGGNGGNGGSTGGGGGTSGASSGAGGGSGGTSSLGGTGGSKTGAGGSGGAQSSGGSTRESSSSVAGSGGSSSKSASGGSSSASSSSGKGGSSGASSRDSSSSSGSSRSGGGGCSLGASPASPASLILALALTLLAFRRRRR